MVMVTFGILNQSFMIVLKLLLCTELQKGEKIFDECEKLQFVNNNFKSNNRIFAQKGVFIFGNQTIDNAKTIKILQEEKKPIFL
jgi:hypothetical protein